MSNSLNALGSGKRSIGQAGGQQRPLLLNLSAITRNHELLPFVHARQLFGIQKLADRLVINLPPASQARPADYLSQLGKLARFAAVGISGLGVNLLVLAILLLVPFDSLAVGGEILSAVISTQVAIGWNFLLTDRWVFGRDMEGWGRRFLPFWAMSCTALFAQLPLAAVLQRSVGNSYVLATAMAIGLLMVLRYLVCDRWLYRPRRNRGRRRALTGPSAS